jgi:hypothetical protein
VWKELRDIKQPKLQRISIPEEVENPVDSIGGKKSSVAATFFYRPYPE